nr:LOW QUALITY PROTEIN: pyroglutamyl-peptidase 1-like protein [Cavia porcellus]
MAQQDWKLGMPTTPLELFKLGLGPDMQVELRTLQLPVDYREVKQKIVRIWKDFQPQLAVHVGVDTSAKAIFLEQCGKNCGYRDGDIRGFRPEGGVCLPGGPEVIVSKISMKMICKCIAIEDVEVTFSGDAGRYVCDYTYYLSLHHGNGHAALIHVPPLSHWFPASLLGKALQAIIREMLEQVGKFKLKAKAAENRTALLLPKGRRLGNISFTEKQMFSPLCSVQLCLERLLKIPCKTVYTERKNSKLAQQSHRVILLS